MRPIMRGATKTGAGSPSAQEKAKPTAKDAPTGTAEAAEALQKSTQNLIASLISVPTQPFAAGVEY